MKKEIFDLCENPSHADPSHYYYKQAYSRYSIKCV